MRVAIVGANGQLGSELVKALSGWDIHRLTRPHCDVRDYSTVRSRLTAIGPHAVVNSAAMTRVDDCESDTQTAFDVNARAVRNIASVCADLKAVFVQVSTDYVFGGEKRTPYGEHDIPHPLNVYGVSKLAGEHFVRAMCSRYLIVRTSGLYGAASGRGQGGNFVETMLRLAAAGGPIRVVDDQVLTPTYAADLARAVHNLLLQGAHGVFHVTNAGQCSWYEFAGKIFELLKLTPDFGATDAASFGARARRPPYSVLANDHLTACGFDELRPWPDALKAYLGETRGLQ